MLSLHAVPRKLAGDLMLLSKGIRPLQIFRQAFEATVVHVTDSGGNLHPINPGSLPQLFRTEWVPIQQHIHLVHSLRDLF